MGIIQDRLGLTEKQHKVSGVRCGLFGRHKGILRACDGRVSGGFEFEFKASALTIFQLKLMYHTCHVTPPITAFFQNDPAGWQFLADSQI